jgi:hypothetical protein
MKTIITLTALIIALLTSSAVHAQQSLFISRFPAGVTTTTSNGEAPRSDPLPVIITPAPLQAGELRTTNVWDIDTGRQYLIQQVGDQVTIFDFSPKQ